MNPIINLLKDKKSNKNPSTPILPKHVGWIEKKLNKSELDFIWYCIEKKSNHNDIQHNLAGNITASYELKDHKNLFWTSVVNPLIKDFEDYYLHKSDGKLRLEKLWVNYQKQTEFNPIHFHTGVYSFVIWLKIPTRHEDQKKLPIASQSNSSTISNFQFTYTDILGKIRSYDYIMSPEAEGTMLLFPATLSHQVYPFYNCDDTRISVSGNVSYYQ
tara:strand:- start:179 stop:823 length:645 start_codon:yes stop_codon:yes gene_type:complete